MISAKLISRSGTFIKSELLLDNSNLILFKFRKPLINIFLFLVTNTMTRKIQSQSESFYLKYPQNYIKYYKLIIKII